MAPPDSFAVVTIGARNVTLSWTIPEESGRNGIITGYSVICADGGGITLAASNLMATVGGLNPYSLYMCSVTASTSAGAGPAATLNFTTASEGTGFLKWGGGELRLLHASRALL